MEDFYNCVTPMFIRDFILTLLPYQTKRTKFQHHQYIVGKFITTMCNIYKKKKLQRSRRSRFSHVLSTYGI